MAPKRAGRPAGSAAKKLREDPVIAKIAEVAEMVKEASSEDYPTDVVKMLSGNVRDTLRRTKEERHAFQSSTVDMIGQVLESIERRRTATVAELEAKVADAGGEQATRDALVESAIHDVKTKAEAEEAAKKAHKEASAAAAEAAKELATAKADQKAGDASYEKAVQSKARIETVQGGEYAALKLGEPGAIRLRQVKKVGQDFDFDSQLVDAMQTTLTTPLASRGTFDGLVVRELDAAFASTLAGLTEQINGEESARAARAAAVEAATTKNTEALAVEAERKAAAEAAVHALKEAETARKEAVRSAKDFGPEMKQTNASLAEAKTALEEARGVVATFKELAERTAPPPEPVVVDEAPAAADAVAAPAA